MSRIDQNNFEGCFRHIADNLLLSKKIPEDIGLFSGKMGVAIFCYQYARITGKPEFEDIAERLLDEVFAKVNVATPVYFRDGLAGIGWGIEFLVQNGFTYADTNEILVEVDLEMFGSLRFDDITSIGLNEGLLGIGFYFLSRIRNPLANDDLLPTLMVKYYLVFLIDELERRMRNLTSIIHEPLLRSRDEKLVSSIMTYWNYPMLIWFLAEFLDSDIFNYKAEKIILRLIQHCKDDNFMPAYHVNRLILLFSITRLRKSIINISNTSGVVPDLTSIERSELIIVLDKKIGTILHEIKRDNITNEINNKGVVRADSAIIISWIYRQLCMLIKNSVLQKESDYWANKLWNSICEYKISDNTVFQDIMAFNILLSDCIFNESVSRYVLAKHKEIIT